MIDVLKRNSKQIYLEKYEYSKVKEEIIKMFCAEHKTFSLLQLEAQYPKLYELFMLL